MASRALKPIKPTATINSLPVECLEHILSYLWFDPSSLSNLAQVSRYFFTLAIPILYSSPFSRLSLCSPSFTQLCKVLLNSTTNNGSLSIPKFLEAAKGQCGSLDCDGQCKQGPILQAIIDQNESTSDNIQSIELTTPPITSTMAKYLGYMTSYDAHFWKSYAASCLCNEAHKHLVTKLMVHMQTRIIDCCAERLTTMNLLPGTIRDLIPFAHRLKSLVQLQFVGTYSAEELKYIKAFLLSRQHRLEGNQDNIISNNDAKYQTSTVRDIERFEMPLVIHPHVPSLSILTNQIQNIHSQKLEILRTLGPLVYLNMNSCASFMNIAHQVPCRLLKRLRIFKFNRGSLDGNAELFLRRCRVLHDLEFASFHQDIFDWAVKEKRNCLHQASMQRTTAFSKEASLNSGTSTNSSPSSFSDLVQLKNLHLRVSQWVVGSCLLSASNAFSHSLESLVLEVYDLAQIQSTFSHISIPQLKTRFVSETAFKFDMHTFRLPHLKIFRLWSRLSKRNYYALITFGMASFDGCPKLEVLFLDKNVVSLSSGGYKEFNIPRLKYLDIDTGPDNHLSVQSIRYSLAIETIILNGVLSRALLFSDNEIFWSMYRHKHGFVWTWKLLNLTKLQLAGGSAFQFRFDWLRHCPNLMILSVDGLIPSSFYDIDPIDPEDTVYSSRIHTCILILYDQISENESIQAGVALAKVLEAYCKNVKNLTLYNYISPHTETQLRSTVRSGRPNTRWRHLHLDVALYASRNLNHLELLTTKIGIGPSLTTLMKRFDLVRGQYFHCGQNVHIQWCKSIPFKEFKIKMEDMDIFCKGCPFFRQRASWEFSLQEHK